jgi:beta-N-acetylhexosaminidase
MPKTHRDPTLSRLAHSVLWPGFDGLQAPDWLMKALDHGLGGTVYFAQNLDADDPQQAQELSARIHAANPDALIGIDEEGGIVTRLETARGSSTPGNAVLGRLDDPDVTERTAAWIGRMVAAAGVDIDLAPTVDVNANPRNPVIGVRSFSADPAVVARHAAAYVRGIQAAGIAACLKHFPGHGDTVTDSHLDAATSNIDLDQLRAVHLPPFIAAIEAGAKAVMSAHIRIPALGDLPATLNAESLGIVRQLGFDGVLITDALDMAAIRATVGMGPGAVAALNAGADLLCVGNPATNSQTAGMRTDEFEFNEVLHAIYAALTSGELPVDRVEEAAARNSKLAAWCRSQPTSPQGAGPFDGAALATRALEVVGDVRLHENATLVIDARTRRNIAVGDAPDFFTVAMREFGEVNRVALAGLAETEAAAQALAVLAEHPGDVVLLVNQPQSSSFEAHLLSAVLGARPDVVVVYAGWPGEGAPDAHRAIFSYGASRASALAVARALRSR